MKTKRIRKILLVVVALGLLLCGGGYAARHVYVKARQTRLVKQARTYLAKPNERKALLCLQRALHYNPKDIEACRLMAELTQLARSPAALLWRSRVVEFNPRSLDDRLLLAQTAMMFREYGSATNALEGVAPAGKQTAAYHNIAGAVASTVGQFSQAEVHFLEAARLEPTNAVPRLNLAVVRLHGTNAQAQAEARAMLSQISSSNRTLRCQALRELVVDATQHQQTNAAMALTRELVQQTNSLFTDRLLRLAVLQGCRNGEFKPTLAAFQREAGTNTEKIYELGVWQMANTGPAETFAWLRTLPMSLQTNQPAALLAAECQTMLNDWKALQASIEKQHWGELEFLRHVFQSRALRGQELGGAAKVEWELAVKAANAAKSQKSALATLLRLAAQWNWQNESEEILWTFVNHYPEELSARQALMQFLLAGGRTRSLLQLFILETRHHPASLPMKNNLAMTALLLDASELKPHVLAREVYLASPTNSSYASTYAFSLHVQQKNAEALKVLEQLSPQALESPSIAGYYGMVLKATGNGAKANRYFEAASKASLLPEEKKLMDRARAGA